MNRILTILTPALRRLREMLLLLVVLLATALSICGCDGPERGEGLEPDDSTIYGTVTCEGVGVQGVVVSDGYDVTLTDEQGCYSMKSDKFNGYVFISVPSGYEVWSDGVLPRFFVRCSRASGREKADFRLTRVDQSEYEMLVFGDMHLADRTFCRDLEQFREFAAEVCGHVDRAAAEGKPVYALTLGDMAWDVFWSSNNFSLKEYVGEIQNDFGHLPIYHTMGNHDNDPALSGDSAGESTYESIIGPNYYSFNAGGVHYIVLDDMVYQNAVPGTRDYKAQVNAVQLSWLRKDLIFVPKNTPVMVSMHTPLYRRDGGSSLSNLSELIKYFDGYERVQFLTGHTHYVFNIDNLDRSVHIYESNSGAVCGAWWMTDYACQSGIHLCTDGAPGGYRIMEISGSEISWRYKGTSCPDDYQFRSYDRNSICLSTDKYTPHASSAAKSEFLTSAGAYANRSTANQVLINVWDYDPQWKVSVTENGRELPVTRLKDAKDPLYIAVYEAYEHEHGYSVSYPGGATSHIFSVTASSPNSTLEISVTDRFGRTYSETMSRPKPFAPDRENWR